MFENMLGWMSKGNVRANGDFAIPRWGEKKILHIATDFLSDFFHIEPQYRATEVNIVGDEIVVHFREDNLKGLGND